MSSRKRPRTAASAPAAAPAAAPALALEGGELRPGLVKLWRERTLCDAEIRVEGETFHAHRLVLAATCDYFAALYCRAGYSADAAGPLTLDGLSADAFRALLSFVYSGRCELAEEALLTPLLEAAARLQVVPLIREASAAIEARLSPESAVDAWALADALQLPDLERAAKTEATKGFHAIAEGDSLLRLPHARLCALVADDGLRVRCESSVFEAVVRWAGAVEPAPEAVTALLAHVRFPLLPPLSVRALQRSSTPL